MSGLTEDGLVVETLETLRAGMEADVREEFGPSVPLGDGTIAGHFIGMVAERLASVWQLGEKVYNAQDPDAATGAALDAVCSITGTQREAASRSAVTLLLTGTPATVVAIGSRAKNGNDDLFVTLEEVTITLVDSWASSTAYSVTDRVTNATRVYQCTTAGVSAGSGGPTTTASAITDGSVTWKYVGEGTAAIDADSAAEESGPIVGAAGDISTIDTPVSGWSSVTNLLDASEGADEQSDEELRIARELELATPGTSPLAAVAAALFDVEGVTAVTVFENNTDLVDADGVPPHSLECLVEGGDDQDIWDCLLANVAGGIRTHGDETGTSTDSAGNVHAMEFTRPEEVEIWVTITLEKTALYPVDGDAQVKAAIVAWGAEQPAGKNAVAFTIGAQALNVTGVIDVTLPLIKDAITPTVSTTIQISQRQRATYDTSRIIVITTTGIS